MSKPSIEELRQKVGSTFLLVNLASRRARELVTGSPKLIETENTDPLDISLEEIVQGRVAWSSKENIPEEEGEDGGELAVEEEEVE